MRNVKSCFSRWSLLALTVAILSACGGSGSGGSGDGTGDATPQPLKGQFIDAPVAGLAYQTATRSGVTDADGYFTFDIPGEDINFSVGEISIGSARANTAVYVNDIIVTQSEIQNNKHAKIAQIIQSLDVNEGGKNIILLPSEINTLSANWADKIRFSSSQSVFDDSLIQFFSEAKVGKLVSVDVAKSRSDSFAVSAKCALPPPSSPDAPGIPYRIEKVGNLSCQEIANISYYNARIKPYLISSATLGADTAQIGAEAFNEETAKNAIDTNPILNDFQTIDTMLENLDDADKGEAVEKTAAYSKIIAKTLEVYLNDTATLTNSSPDAITAAEQNKKSYEITAKLIETLTGTNDCLQVMSDKNAAVEKCFAVLSVVIETFNTEQSYLVLSKNPEAMKLMLTTIADGFELVSQAFSKDFTNKKISKVGMQRAAAKLASSMLKLTRDGIELALLSNGQKVPTQGVGAVALGLVDQVAAPILNIASKCGGKTDFKSGVSAVWACSSAQVQEVSKVVVNASFATIGMVEAVRNVGVMNDAIVSQAVLEELLYAGASGYTDLLRKYGVSGSNNSQLTTKLINEIASKKLGLYGVYSYQDIFGILYAATFKGQNSFKTPNVWDVVTGYQMQISQLAPLDFSSPGLEVVANIKNTGAVALDVQVVPKAYSISRGKLACYSPGANLYGYDAPWRESFSGFNNFFVNFEYAKAATYTVTCALYKTDGVLLASKTLAVKFSPSPVLNTPLTVNAGDALQVWWSNLWNAVKSVVVNFGETTQTVVLKVTDHISEAVSHLFGSTGEKTITATFNDQADGTGNTLGTSTAKVTVLVGQVTQTATITNVQNDDVSPAVTIASGSTTTDNTPLISGTISEPLSQVYTVRIYGGSTVLGTATVTGTSWTFKPATALANGSYPLKAVVFNAASSQEGTASLAWTVTVTTTTPAATSKLNDTGITSSQCYAAGSNTLVSCTSAAAISLNSQQDGMLGRDVTNSDSTDGKLGFSFSLVPNVSGIAGLYYSKNECVKDNVTGLMWEGKPADNSFRDYRKTYTNYGDNRTGDASAYVDAVNAGDGLCGHKDWRLPTVDELQSMVDYGVAFPGPTIDGTWFINSQNSLYWSSSPNVGDSSFAWFVDFDDGLVSYYGRSYTYAVRLVRASQ